MLLKQIQHNMYRFKFQWKESLNGTFYYEIVNGLYGLYLHLEVTKALPWLPKLKNI